LGLYRKKVRGKEKIRKLFVNKIAYRDLVKGVYSLSDILFLLKVFVKTKKSTDASQKLKWIIILLLA
ncbi:glycosyl transferase, partial [Salmonella enterica subsp. enterica serovar Mbandaka]